MLLSLNMLYILENSAMVSYQLKNAPVLSSSSSTPRDLPRRNENICPQKDLC